MTDVNLTNVLVSALTAAGVTLGVEWAAKPRLEARKERILRRHRARSDVSQHLASIMLNAAKLRNGKMPAGLNNDGRTMWISFQKETSDEVLVATRALEHALVDTALFMQTRLRRILSVYVGWVRGVVHSDRTLPEKGQVLAAYTAPILDAVGGPGQGLPYKVRLIHRARQLREAERLLLPGRDENAADG